MKTDISELRPTQMSVGLLEVEKKAKKLHGLNPEERDAFLKQKLVPVVHSPKGKFFIIDHHHLCRAVLDSGHSHVYVQIIEDLSNILPEQFWDEMKKKNYVYLLDDRGKKIEHEDIPKHIKDLTDDPYRSLAGFVRDEGGYLKVKVPFSEFQWASFFRKHLEFKGASKEELDKVLPLAMKLAQSKEAEHLPGFIR